MPPCDLCGGSGVYVGLKPEVLADLAKGRKDLTTFAAEDLLRYEAAKRSPVNCLPPEPCVCRKEKA